MSNHSIRIAFFVFLFGIPLIYPIKGVASSPFDSASLLKVYEDSIKSIQHIRIDARTDKEKEVANTRLFSLLNIALLLPHSFDYSFDSLTTIGFRTSPDNQFRLITWDVPKSGGINEYYGFIQSYNTRKKKYDLFVLKDKATDITNLLTATLTPDKWVGMLYYAIIKQKNSKAYIVLAMQRYNKLINRKIIDVLSFNAEGIPSFGKAIFENLPSTFKGNPKRLVFEYSADVSMSLRYDDTKNMILFDHLGPIEEGLTGQHQYYSPSFRVDGLSYKGSSWSYVANVEARNASSKNDSHYNDPKHPTTQQDKRVIYAPH